jgi:Fe-S-cluster containining protein
VSPVGKQQVDQLLGRFAAHLDGGAPTPAVSRDQAVAITRRLHAEVDRGVALRDQQFAAQGHPIACARGCSACCEQVVSVSDAEAWTVAQWLAEPERAAVRARFERAHAAWRAAGADLIDRVAAALQGDDGERLAALVEESLGRRLMCPFNHEDACEIYPVRPGVCRNHAAIDSAEPCQRRDGSAKNPSFVPLDAFMERVNGLHAAMQESLHPERPGGAPLADRVIALLAVRDRPAVGRNDPCPCGSGKKHKRCCGADAT